MQQWQYIYLYLIIHKTSKSTRAHVQKCVRAAFPVRCFWHKTASINMPTRSKETLSRDNVCGTWRERSSYSGETLRACKWITPHAITTNFVNKHAWILYIYMYLVYQNYGAMQCVKVAKNTRGKKYCDPVK